MKDPQREADEFNDAVSVGAEIEFWNTPNDKPGRTTTRTKAEVLSGHTAVVWLNNVVGCWALSHVRAVDKK